VSVCLCNCPHYTKKTARAINTRVGRDVVQAIGCVDLEITRSKVRITVTVSVAARVGCMPVGLLRS